MQGLAKRNLNVPMSRIASPEEQPRQCSRMAYHEGTAHTVVFTVDQVSTLPVVLVDQVTGEIVTRDCFTYVLGPTKIVLVSSKFEHFYYVVEGDKCTCPQRDFGCEHVQDGALVTPIRNGQFVEVPWCELTPDEQRAAENVLFASCSYEARWQEAV
jgi:hypothetical protein